MNTIAINNNLSIYCQSFVASAQELLEKDPLAYKRLFSSGLQKRIPIPSLNGFGWMSTLENPKEYDIPKLHLFHNLCISFKYINECDYGETFEPYFIDGKTPQGKLTCMDSANVITVLFRELQWKEIISNRCKLYDNLAFAFHDKRGKGLKRDSLERMASRGVSEQQQKDIDNLIYLLMA